MVNLSREADNLGIKQIAAKHEKDLLSRNILLPEQHKLLLSLEQNSLLFLCVTFSYILEQLWSLYTACCNGLNTSTQLSRIPDSREIERET
jgi:hypothetical protein